MQVSFRRTRPTRRPTSSSFRPNAPGSTRCPKRNAADWRSCAINRSAGRSRRYTANRKKTGTERHLPKPSVCHTRGFRRASPTWSANPPNAISPGGGCSSRSSSFTNRRLHSRCSPIASITNPKRHSPGHSSGSSGWPQDVLDTNTYPDISSWLLASSNWNQSEVKRQCDQTRLTRLSPLSINSSFFRQKEVAVRISLISRKRGLCLKNAGF